MVLMAIILIILTFFLVGFWIEDKVKQSVEEQTSLTLPLSLNSEIGDQTLLLMELWEHLPTSLKKNIAEPIILRRSTKLKGSSTSLYWRTGRFTAQITLESNTDLHFFYQHKRTKVLVSEYGTTKKIPPNWVKEIVSNM